MIYAKTSMKKLPNTCKNCVMTIWVKDDITRKYNKYCSIVGKICPMEKKQSGNYGYTKPNWCPLVCIENPS